MTGLEDACLSMKSGVEIFAEKENHVMYFNHTFPGMWAMPPVGERTI